MVAIEIDGGVGEGGGQRLRTGLTVSLLTGRPLRVVNIRARRTKPGLLRQHLTAVEAARAISGGQVEGAEVGSLELDFTPGAVRAGDHSFSIGTAGSTALVFQTIVLPLLLADRASGAASTVRLEGGTHNPLAPSFTFLEQAYLPVLREMGAECTLHLERAGFYPGGGGLLEARLASGAKLAAWSCVDDAVVTRRRAVALLARVPGSVAERELATVRERLGFTHDECAIRSANATSPGNVLEIALTSARVTEVFTSHGERGVTAERVASRAADEAAAYLASGVPVGPYLADQLLLPLAFGGGGEFVTSELTLHSHTQIDLLQEVLGVAIVLTPHAHARGPRVHVRVEPWSRSI